MGAFFHELYLSLENMSTRKAFCGRLEFLLGTGVIFSLLYPFSRFSLGTSIIFSAPIPIFSFLFGYWRHFFSPVPIFSFLFGYQRHFFFPVPIFSFLFGYWHHFLSPVPISLPYLLSFSVEQYFFHGDKGIAFRLQGIHHLQRRRYGSGVVVVH